MTDYLIHIQYLGFRFHGWQRQPGVKTVESMLIKTLERILGTAKVKILGASRTDAMVSARHSAFCLSLEADTDIAALVADLNAHLPADIRILGGEPAPLGFNIINSPRTKTYHYYFSFGKKAHPFCAPFLTPFPDDLDIDLMKAGAVLFEGKHDFRQYCTRPGEQTRVRRRILLSRIDQNRDMAAGFFPGETWVYRIRAKGFLRNQVRLMMGQLVCLGRGDIGVKGVEQSLSGVQDTPLKTIAPASGLMLHHIEFDPDISGRAPEGQNPVGEYE
jgi:tRNA pseudouridine38-40 synthase